VDELKALGDALTSSAQQPTIILSAIIPSGCCARRSTSTVFGVSVPLYEYQCKQCNHLFERIQKFSDSPLQTCPKCGGPVEQLISPPAIQFKGSGWYVTDYAHKSGASSPSSSNGKSSGKTEASASESKTESKPAPSTSSEKK
jgi:putative FmdB family regulatory protein